MLKSLATLEEGARQMRAGELNQIGKDGLIHRFEITFELAWKTMGDRLRGVGHKVKMSPAHVIREAFAADLIENADVWMQAMDARNNTSHMYDNERAALIAEQVVANYLPAFRSFAAQWGSGPT